MVAFGGDEVSALVLDVGSSWTRAGYAGEDTPKVVVPSFVGSVDNAVDDGGDVRMDTGEATTTKNNPEGSVGKQKKYIVGDAEINYWRPNMEITNPLKDGLVENWDAFENIWDYTLRTRLRADLREHPLFLSESSWNTRENREKMVELAFEQFQVPACFVGKNAVLSTFASGRSTALVLDSGGANTSAVPVFEGYVLKKGIQRHTIAGDFLSQQILNQFEQERNIAVIPQFLVKSKEVVDSGMPANAILRNDLKERTSPSYYWFSKMRVAAEYKESTCQVYEQDYDESVLSIRPHKPFEFPDGYNNNFGAERFKIPEMLFHPAQYITNPTGDHQNALGVQYLAHQSISACDPDARPLFYSNMVVTGGNTLLPGFTDRFQGEVAMLAPGVKIKVHAAGNTTERKYSTWLGGSILASLGTFHQLWISKKEYEEHGASIVERKCL